MRIDKPSKRVEWIDIMKGICMIFVVISHSFPPTPIKRLYTPFFLTGFFFCSGYTFNSKKNFREFIIGKIKTIIVPLVLLSLINGLVGVIFKNVPFTDRLLGIIIQRANGYESLWFIACLFTAEVIFYMVFRGSSNIWAGAIVCHIISIIGFLYVRLVGIALPWQYELACIAEMFLSWGLIYREIEMDLDNKIQAKKYYIWFLAIVYLCLCLLIDNDVNYHEERFANEFIFVIEAIIGLIVIISTSKALQNRARPLVYIGTHSIIFFAFQGFLILTVRKVLSSIGIANILLLSFLPSMISIPILALAAYIIFEYFPILVGKNWKHSRLIRKK